MEAAAIMGMEEILVVIILGSTHPRHPQLELLMLRHPRMEEPQLTLQGTIHQSNQQKICIRLEEVFHNQHINTKQQLQQTLMLNTLCMFVHPQSVQPIVSLVMG